MSAAQSSDVESRQSLRLLLHTIRREVLGEEVLQSEMKKRYAEYFTEFVARGIRAELLDERLANFDLKRLGAALDASRDLKFGYLGLQTLYDRYFLHIHGTRIELPQAFFMLVAMGLAQVRQGREPSPGCTPPWLGDGRGPASTVRLPMAFLLPGLPVPLSRPSGASGGHRAAARAPRGRDKPDAAESRS